MKDAFFEWNRQGLFVSPSETASAFEARAKSSARTQSPCCKLLQEIYDIEPSWVKVVYSKKSLYPWEAGCTWYDTVPWIQLHPKFQNHKTLYGIYSHDEVLAHEYVHAVRAPLESHKFEELFAYLVSQGPLSSFRKLFGPLFSEPRDSLIFVFGIALGLVFSPLILGAITLFFLSRLTLRWLQYMRCKKHLFPLVGKKNLLPLMVRLTDDEIILFSKLSSEKITAYVCKQTCFRWQLFSSIYFRPS